MEAKMIINPKVGIQIPFKLVVVMASKGTRKGSGTKAHIKSKTPKIKKQNKGLEQNQMLQLQLVGTLH
jgi:acid phosphatase family membrane protein YuiD